MNILIAGDFFISDGFRGRDLFDPAVVGLFAGADYRIVNLEAPVTAGDPGNRIFKTGPHLGAAKETIIPFLKKLRLDAVTLANNHIMDYGEPGLADTLASLSEAGIGRLGAGRDLEEARRPLILERDGRRIAVLNFAENEWAGAAPGKAGASPLDLIDNVRQVQAAKKASEFVIVVIHGGFEDFPFPSPGMVKRYRFYAESGAAAVVGHHPHCVSGFEVHHGCPIFYSIGNFVFSLPSEFDSWYEGLILKLELRGDRSVSWDLVPVAQSRDDYRVTLPEGGRKQAIAERVADYSRIIVDDAALGQRWQAFLSDWTRYYLNAFSPLNSIPGSLIRRGLLRLGLDRLFIGKKHYAQILNHLRCEAHAEASRAVIEGFLGGGPK